MTDHGSWKSGSKKTSSANALSKQRKDILGNTIGEDAKHPAHGAWREVVEKEEMWKSDLGLDPLIAIVLEEFHRSDWNHVRIKDRSILHARKYSDTQITAARRKAMRIWPYVPQLSSFRNRLDYEIYDLSAELAKAIGELKRIEGNLSWSYCDLLGRNRSDSDDIEPKDANLRHVLDVESTPMEVQAKQLAHEIRHRLEEADKMEENYEKVDPLLYGVLREFFYANWDDPRIEDRESFKKTYTDSQITAARRKAVRMWPYIRFVMSLKDEPEDGPLEGVITTILLGYAREVHELKRNVTILFKRNIELRRYNRIVDGADPR
jgi:hypothetical protein